MASIQAEDAMTVTSGPGPIALVGSGEYLPQMAEIEASLIEGRPSRYVQLATAAVPDGPSVVEYWHDLGAAQAERLGVEPVATRVTSRIHCATRPYGKQSLMRGGPGPPSLVVAPGRWR
jgi:cyanophycinase